jgi:hypothetical protein
MSGALPGICGTNREAKTALLRTRVGSKRPWKFTRIHLTHLPLKVTHPERIKSLGYCKLQD